MTARDVLDLVWVVPALPLLGAVFLLVFGKRIGEPLAGWIATALLVGSCVWSIVTFAALRSLGAGQRAQVVNLFMWLRSGGLRVEFGFLVDPLSVTFVLFVTVVSTMICVFAIGYMRGDPRFSRFFAYLSLFVAAMLVLVLGSSFLVTFLGWEGVGLCSYLLISFWFERGAAANAGKKAFITTRVGDVGFLVAMFLIFAELGTVDYAGAHSALAGATAVGTGTATAIALLLFLGAAGKSAQFPLHFWLPDAMEGPTPVSALIHAATMVTAGVFLVARAHAFFQVSGDAMAVVAWVGAGSALLAGTIALVQPDIKRVLAYSTISQLGYMFLALGVGAYGAAIFLVIAQAFYKAALFLGAGSVIHADGDNQDMRTMGGLGRYLPYTASAFVVAWLAIAGVPPFSGFFAKDGVLEKAFSAHRYGLWVVGLLAAVLTGAYMTRQVFLVFFANERFRATTSGEHPADLLTGARIDPPSNAAGTPTVAYGERPRPAVLHDDPHEAPRIMTVPVAILAVLAAVGGILDVPIKGLDFLDQWLAPVFADVPAIPGQSFVTGGALSALSVAFGLAGIALAYRLYRRGLPSPPADPLETRLGRVGRLFGHAYYYDERIDRAVAGPVRRFADWLARRVDVGAIDGAVNGVAALVGGLAQALGRLQNGLVRRYALAILAGTAALLLYLLIRAG